MSGSIWNWIHEYYWELSQSGQGEMADKLREFSSIAFDKDQTAVEAAFPELIAFARQQDNKWIEIYLRHWRLQAYVNTNYDPRPLIPEVLDLLAFCQADDTKSCPQSTCVIDDITDIYAAIDAPGFAPERRDMLLETLESLSPRQECYTCMNMSLVDAYVDMGDGAQALKTWHTAKAEDSSMSESLGNSHFHTHLSNYVIRAMITEQEFKQAFNLIERATPEGPDGISYFTSLKVQILLGLGDSDAAKPLFGELLKTDLEDVYVEEFIKCVSGFGDAYMSNKKVMTRTAVLAKFSQDSGLIREAFDAAALAFDIAGNVGAKDVCKNMLEIMEATFPDLHRPLGADETLEKAQAIMG